MNGYYDHTPNDVWHIDQDDKCVCPCDLCTTTLGFCICPDCACESQGEHEE